MIPLRALPSLTLLGQCMAEAPSFANASGSDNAWPSLKR
jgi:hypothetical protein